VKFISFFAGIGGIDLGLERAGHECVGQCEIDPYAIKVLEKHWPDVPRFGDITKVKPDELPKADLWAGGFPCQDISTAGKQAGIHGRRSGLFFDWMRLAATIRPRFMLLENVGALINGGLSEVLGALAESGYDAEWDCIPACAVGAPHRRDRAFIVGHARSGGLPRNNGGRAISIAQNGRENVANTKEQSERPRLCQGEPGRKRRRRSGDGCSETDASDAYSYGFNKGRECLAATGRNGPVRNDWWAVEPDMGRVAYGVPSRVDRLKCLGNAVVPEVAEYIGWLLAELEQANH
jgi:DNA (cytosine-5)-methyltransferase 1